MSNPKAKAVHHVGLSVPDLEAALAFYVDVLGFKLLNRSNWSGSRQIDMAIGAKGSAGKFAMISLNGFCLEVFQFETPRASQPTEPRVVGHGWTHTCVTVDNAQDMVDALKAQGIELYADPVDIGDGPFAYARDPFGNIVEIWQMKS